MNAPTHLAFGALAAQALVTGNLPGVSKLVARCSKFLLVVICFGLGIASHLVIDLLPHTAWIATMFSVKTAPFGWVVPETAFGIVVAIPALYLAGRKNAALVLAGMIGTAYPDIEKVLSIEFGLPDVFVLFDWHSKYLSTNDGGLPEISLIVIEISLIALCLLLIWKMKVNAGASGAGCEGAPDHGPSSVPRR